MVLIDAISDNIASLGHGIEYGAINTAYTTTMRYYIVKYVFEAFKLQEYITTDGQLSKRGELVIRSDCLKNKKGKTNWYWEQRYLTKLNCINPYHFQSMTCCFVSETCCKSTLEYFFKETIITGPTKTSNFYY